MTKTMSRLAVAALALTPMLATAACADIEEEGDTEALDAQSEALGAGVKIETTFAEPKGDTKDMRILDELVRLIDAAQPGSTIDFAIHSISVNEVKAAIMRARTPARGVTIRVAHNGEDIKAEDSTPRDLALALKPSEHRWCGNVDKGGKVGGCIANGQSSIMHSKLVLFSKTRDKSGAIRSNVSWFGSANMTFQTGAKTFNNTVTVYGDKELYEELEQKYFERLWNEKHGDVPTIASAGSHVSVATSPSGPDLILARLAGVVPTAGCNIRVAQAMIHNGRRALVERLVQLKKGGCDVFVAANPGGADQPMIDLMKAGGIVVKKAHTHDKLVLVQAKTGCGTPQGCKNEKRKKIVFTGSHNWTSSANGLNDELFVRIEDDATYDSFVKHFGEEYDGHTAF